jgi:hypothetical protein
MQEVKMNEDNQENKRTMGFKKEDSQRKQEYP